LGTNSSQTDNRQTTDRQQTDIFELTPIHMGNLIFFFLHLHLHLGGREQMG
jgi:hypothetical protein